MSLVQLASEIDALHDVARRYLNIVEVWERIPGFKEKHPLHVPPRQMALCPFHGEKTPSCRVYYNSQRFHCYGCGKNGDVIFLLEQLDECESKNHILCLPVVMQEDHARYLRQTLENYAGQPLP